MFLKHIRTQIMGCYNNLSILENLHDCTNAGKEIQIEKGRVALGIFSVMRNHHDFACCLLFPDVDWKEG